MSIENVTHLSLIQKATREFDHLNFDDGLWKLETAAAFLLLEQETEVNIESKLGEN